jgi:hypothetical protein
MYSWWNQCCIQAPYLPVVVHELSNSLAGRRAPQLLQLDCRFQRYEAVGLSFFQITLAVILQQRTPHLIYSPSTV